MFTLFRHFTKETVAKGNNKQNRYKNNLPLLPQICLFFVFLFVCFSVFKLLFCLKCMLEEDKLLQLLSD